MAKPAILEPHPDTLLELRNLLVRFRFSCEECGLWPGASMLPGLFLTEMASGILPELRVACDDWFQWRVSPPGNLDPPLKVTRGNQQLVARGWPLFWNHEIVRVVFTTSVVVRAIELAWFPGIDTRPIVQTEIEGKIFSMSGAFAGGTFCNPDGSVSDFPPIPAVLAEALDRCVRRLEEILAQGPRSIPAPFIPGEKQKHVLELLRGKGMTLDVLAVACRADRSTFHRTILKPLQEAGLVKNNRKVGYFRPDDPPTPPPPTPSKQTNPR